MRTTSPVSTIQPVGGCQRAAAVIYNTVHRSAKPGPSFTSYTELKSSGAVPVDVRSESFWNHSCSYKIPWMDVLETNVAIVLAKISISSVYISRFGGVSNFFKLLRLTVWEGIDVYSVAGCERSWFLVAICRRRSRQLARRSTNVKSHFTLRAFTADSACARQTLLIAHLLEQTLVWATKWMDSTSSLYYKPSWLS